MRLRRTDRLRIWLISSSSPSLFSSPAVLPTAWRFCLKFRGYHVIRGRAYLHKTRPLGRIFRPSAATARRSRAAACTSARSRPERRSLGATDRGGVSTSTHTFSIATREGAPASSMHALPLSGSLSQKMRERSAGKRPRDQRGPGPPTKGRRGALGRPVREVRKGRTPSVTWRSARRLKSLGPRYLPDQDIAPAIPQAFACVHPAALPAQGRGLP